MHRRDALRAVGAGLGVGALGFGGRARASAAPPYAPLSHVGLVGAKEAVVGGGRTAYLAVTDGYAAVDVSDPARPVVVAERRGLLADREGGPLTTSTT